MPRLWRRQRVAPGLLWVLISLLTAFRSGDAAEKVLKVFLYDHETFPTLHSEDQAFNRTFASYASPPLGGLVERLAGEQMHFAYLELALGIRPAVQKSSNFMLTDTADAADFVLVAVYEQAVCYNERLSRIFQRKQGFDHQKLPLHDALSCGRLYQNMYSLERRHSFQKAVWALYRALQASPRWQRHQGRDFVMISAKLHPWIFAQKLPYGQLEAGATPENLNFGQASAYQLALNAMFASIEERRIPEESGASVFIPLPYLVSKHKWWLRKPPENRRTFVQMDAGACETINHCEVCEAEGLPSSMDGGKTVIGPGGLRRQLFSQLHTLCRDERKKCSLMIFDGTIEEESGKVSCEQVADRHRGFANHEASLLAKTTRSNFCIVPRGDSAASRRFYNAILRLCIPVVISNAFPFPFPHKVDYSQFVIQVPEEQAFANTSAVVDTLMSIPLDQLREMRKKMKHARKELIYEGKAIANLLDALHHRMSYVMKVQYNIYAKDWKTGGLWPDSAERQDRDGASLAPFSPKYRQERRKRKRDAASAQTSAQAGQVG